jgi:hypothetical protein
VTINYTLDEDIVYYAESENMAGTRSYGEAASYSSNGVSYCSSAAANSYIATNWSVAAGYYDIEVGMANRSYSVNPAPKLMTNSTDESPTVLGGISLSASSYTQKTYLSQQIAAGQNLYIFNDNGSNASKWALDYVILRKLPTSVSVTVTDAGYATLFVDNADVTVPAGVTAYIAEFEEKWLKLSEVGGTIPAATPVILKGAPAIYEFVVPGTEIPVPDDALVIFDDEVNGSEALVKAETQDAFENNVLKGAAEDIAAAGKYVLAKVDDPLTEGSGYPVAFCKADKGTIKAGKAYLELSSDIKAFYFWFPGEDPTGIRTIENAQLTVDGVIYNIAGQRIQKMQKGVNIVNGKKVMVK